MGLYDPTRFWDEFGDELLGFTLDVLFSMVRMTEMLPTSQGAADRCLIP